MDLRLKRYNSSESDDESDSEDDFPSDSSKPQIQKTESPCPVENSEKCQNIMFKLFNREHFGHFSGNYKNLCRMQSAFSSVPSRLSFCLKDIVPYCYLQGHIFMGLTLCGQFLVSYKVCYDENSLVSNYSFSTYYKYTLYFWIYRPHQPLAKYFKVCMFDDHGVDNLKVVTMTQWTTNPRTLIAHGAKAPQYENEDSYVTIVRVPKLGCFDCKELRDMDDNRCDVLCIKCNLTIHSKYSTTESDPEFNPKINLLCPERIILIANGFLHMLNVDLEVQKILHQTPNSLQSAAAQNQNLVVPLISNSHNKEEKWLVANSSTNLQETSHSAASKHYTTDAVASSSSTSSNPDIFGCDNKNNIVARIIADFSDYESDSQTNSEKSHHDKVVGKNYDELIFTCGLSLSENVSSTSNSSSSAKGNKYENSSNSVQRSSINQTTSQMSKVNLLNHLGKKNHRIVTKSYRNGVTTIDLQSISTSGTTSSTNNDKAALAYEFSEDTEKCEKIGTFRKRRLADKKYEFTEDNSENVVPFNKSRFSSSLKSRILRPLTSAHHSTATGTVYVSSLASQSFETTTHSHRASPSQGFRSPCGSPVGGNGGSSIVSGSPTTATGTVSNRLIRSPVKNQQIFIQKSPPQSLSPNYQLLTTQTIPSVKPLSTLSPLQISAAKRNHFEIGNISPITNPFLSPRRDDTKVFEMPLEGVLEPQEKPICTKISRRRYVEEDEAISVITSEEDDCISPGYHTSLPVEVHGSCYSEMKMISQTSYEQLRTTSVLITQHSFDLETFTYYVISKLCQKNNKTYNVFYDWACEIINVCPRSNTLSCMLMAHFIARDQLTNTTKKCINCSRNIDCAFHRKQYECRILFAWNMESGDWEVLDYGQLNEIPKKAGAAGLTKIAKTLALEIAGNLDKMHNYAFNLRILDSNLDKSKNKLIDLDNMIEFYRKKPKLSRTNCAQSDDEYDDNDSMLDY